ncbi:PAS domain S-box protein [Cohaesibacter sp. CAU 1516]|uniref:PAS domain-containing protein n=1 Tax=Cohaesibacter sp. CAU 1516 TaxID=2576038 RepID=UPI0010FDA2BE|nr:PAS domain-containing protein [Cohaesibacter sp. CAU 1516]TLP45015.1 PAS domain S-box protein [Cohaesibacter sp. CAU 1516]
MAVETFLSGNERYFGDDDIIVSKTDLKGRLTYANKIFLDISGYQEKEVLGQPHSLIRHPEMPRCIFKLLWSTLEQGKEIFAYVNNRSKNGDNYWVYAHVTPSWDKSGKIVGYHSNRRVPDRDILDQHIIPLYKDLVAKEKSTANRKDGMHLAETMLNDLLVEKQVAYDEFIATVGQRRRRGYR